MTGLEILGALAGVGGVSGVVASVVTGLLARPKTRADAAGVLTDAALRQVNELQEETVSARAEARAARDEAAAAARQVHRLAREVDALMGRLLAWRAAILAPDARVEDLRVMVTTDPGVDRVGR